MASKTMITRLFSGSGRLLECFVLEAPDGSRTRVHLTDDGRRGNHGREFRINACTHEKAFGCIAVDGGFATGLVKGQKEMDSTLEARLTAVERACREARLEGMAEAKPSTDIEGALKGQRIGWAFTIVAIDGSSVQAHLVTVDPGIHQKLTFRPIGSAQPRGLWHK